MPRANILLQTTIRYDADDWHVGRFSLLREYLSSLCDEHGERLFDVRARDREHDPGGNDPVLSGLDESDIDQLWLFAVDVGDGLTEDDCAGITRFLKRGGGILSMRDHFDLGSSLCTLGGIGDAHYFHSKNPDPDDSRHVRDDDRTLSIDFPNYHSGSNGDVQRVDVIEPSHELFRRPDGSAIEYFPAHPHEGAVGASGNTSKVLAKGRSKVTGRDFNLVVALENGPIEGRALAHSSFHHFVDYNWDTSAGCPSFLEEPPGDQLVREPEKLDDIKHYAANAARWLSRLEVK